MATSTINNEFKRTIEALFPNGSVIDANAITYPFAIANGWDENKANFPTDFVGDFGMVLTIPFWRDDLGKTGKDVVQVLISVSGKAYVRRCTNPGTWTSWRTLY